MGKHLIMHLRQHGHDFTVISRKEPLPPWNDCKFVLSSALDGEHIRMLALSHDVVVYLASSSIPGSSTMVNELDNNVRPAVDFCNAITDHNPNLNIIYLSSGGQIYGNWYSTPIRESSECKPISPYAYGKLLIEQSLAYLHRRKNIKIVILRVANLVGQWQMGTQQGLVNVAIQCVQHHRMLSIFGTGSEVRDYIDADDVAAVIEMIAGSPCRYEVFNVGTGKAVSTLDIIHLVESCFGKQIEKQYLSRRPVDPEYAVLDCSKIFDQYAWSANNDISSIVLKAIEGKRKSNIL